MNGLALLSTSNSHYGPFGLMLPSPGPVTGSTTSQPLFYNQATTTKAASSQPPTSIPQDRRAVSLLPLLAHRPHLPGSNRPCSRASTHHRNQRIVPTLQNIVATVNSDCHLDLKTIVLHTRNAEYNPRLVSLTVLIFASGRVPSLKTIHD